MNRLLISGLTLCLFACSSDQQDSAEPPRIEETVVSIEIFGLAGLNEAVEARRGQGYLINFWAMWCGPCVAELPELVEVAAEYRERGGEVVAISYDLMIPGDDATSIRPKMAEFMEQKKVDVPVWIFDGDDYDGINERFDLEGGVPVTLAIDESGAIVDRHKGKAGKARFDEMMRRALGLN
jgi:thiol-disulfide isomerase/thioredoxin